MSDPFATIPKSIPKKKKKKPTDLEAVRQQLAALKIKKIPKKPKKKPTVDLPDDIIEDVTEQISTLSVSKPKPIAKKSKPKAIAKKSKPKPIAKKPIAKKSGSKEVVETEECFCKNKHPTKWYPRCAVCLSQATPEENWEHSKKLGPPVPMGVKYETPTKWVETESKHVPNPSGITHGPNAYQWMPTVEEMLDPENREKFQKMFREREKEFWGVNKKPKWLVNGPKPSNKVFI